MPATTASRLPSMPAAPRCRSSRSSALDPYAWAGDHAHDRHPYGRADIHSARAARYSHRNAHETSQRRILHSRELRRSRSPRDRRTKGDERRRTEGLLAGQSVLLQQHVARWASGNDGPSIIITYGWLGRLAVRRAPSPLSARPASPNPPARGWHACPCWHAPPPPRPPPSHRGTPHARPPVPVCLQKTPPTPCAKTPMGPGRASTGRGRVSTATVLEREGVCQHQRHAPPRASTQHARGIVTYTVSGSGSA